MADIDHVFQTLCHEAVLACGEDFPAIERYVLDQLRAMDESSRLAVGRELERMLALHIPAQLARLH